jgi:hypothetical protein
MPKEQADRIQNVVEYIRRHTAPGEPIYDFTNQGAYYYFSDRPPATRLFMMSQTVTTTLERQVIDALERTRVSLVIFSSPATDDLELIWSDERRPVIAAYLERHFERAAEVGGLTIARRRLRADEGPVGASSGSADTLLSARRRLPEAGAISVSLVSPALRGFGAVEGPYPQWDPARPVRWMEGTKAEIRFRGNGTSHAFRLRMRVLSMARNQRLDVFLNGVPIVEHPFGKAGEWEPVVSREFTPVPENRLTFRAARTMWVQGRDLGVLFDDIAVTEK